MLDRKARNNVTWQGGKQRRESAPASPFARLTPLAGEGDDPATGLRKLAKALSGYPNRVALEVRLLSGNDGDESVERWQINAGTGDPPRRPAADSVDVIVVMRPETWMLIAQGRLAPYEALYSGRLRVGGNFEAAKALTRALSDPATPYVSPC